MSWFNGKRIVVPFDFSDESTNAVRLALQMANRPDEVHVAHVLQELPPTDPVVIWGQLDDEARKRAIREQMESLFAEQQIEGVQINVSIGNPSRMIADLAEEIEAGLIVIPSHGYSGVRRWFLGSVAERVVQLAACPVLVLKD